MAAVYRYHCQSGLFITLLHLMITHSWWLCVYYYEMYIVDTIMHDGCEMSTRPSFFELDLPCFWIRPSLFWLGPTVFRVRLSHFSGQSFPKSVLLIFRVSPSDFSKPVLLIFRVRPFHFFGSVLPNFLSQSFSFFDSDLPFFLSQSFLFFDSGLPFFLSQSFSFFESNLPFFLSQSFSFFESALPFFLSQCFSFFESDLPIFLGQSFPLFQVSSSHFSSQISFPFSSLCLSGFCLFFIPVWSPCALLTKLKT